MSRLFVLLQILLPKRGISRLAAWFAGKRILKNFLIKTFIRRYRVNMSESLIEQPEGFGDFNAFFTRQLKPGARPICADADAVLSPADGVVSECGAIVEQRLLQAKGKTYTLASLLGDANAATQFTDGTFVTVYLSPRDYHRVHMPLTGRLAHSTHIPGSLFSVNPASTAGLANLFARNERVVSLFDTGAGPVAVILVGALVVAGIEMVWPVPDGPQTRRQESPLELPAGAEMGRFLLGSTVILLFGPGRVQLESALQAGTALQMGQAIGRIGAASLQPLTENHNSDSG